MWHSNIYCALGVLIGLPQIIPFLRYLPKTIRKATSEKVEVKFFEKSWYIGILPVILALFSTSRIWPLFILSLVMSRGYFGKYLPRVPERWLVLTQFSLGWMAVSGLYKLHLSVDQIALLLFIQGFDLYWHNKSLIPTLPYAELYNRPSRAFKTQLTTFLESHLKPDERVSGLPYPLFTGIINNIKTLGYCGGMQLKLMAKFRGDTDPNGAGAHDWFKLKGDDEALDRHRIKFSYSRKRIDWPSTSCKRVYQNPRI